MLLLLDCDGTLETGQPPGPVKLEQFAPFPSFGFGNSRHRLAPYAVGPTAPILGVSSLTAHGAGRPRLHSVPLRARAN